MPSPSSISVNTGDIVATVREPLLVLNSDLRVQLANRSFLHNFGVTEEATVGTLLYELGNGQWNIPALRELLERILPDKSTFDDFEVNHEFPSIGRKTMLLNARRVDSEQHGAPLILLAIEDVTEQRQLEAERRQLETRFTSLVKNIRDHSIFTLDREGRITSWNHEAEKILRYCEEEALGQQFSMIFSDEDQENGIPAQELGIALRDGRAEDERWHVRKGGERFWALGIVTPIHDESGTHTGFSKILRDMTERKRAEEALQLADRRKDEFLATLAHELRNPMAPLRNSLQLLKLSKGDPIVQEEAREAMDRQLGQLVRLVDDLLDITRINHNKLELRRTIIDLRTAIENAVETARPEIDANGHRLRVMLPAQPVYVDGDLTRLAQVFWNLLSNSGKYTEPGGEILLSAETDGGNALICVQDNGIGIPADSLPSLFEMFSQVDRSLERAQGGLGIGLALVRSLVQAHGGHVQVHSQGKNQGSRFVVSLPLAHGSPTHETVLAPANLPHSAGRRVLIVDDNRDGAASMARLLTSMGNETRVAFDGLAGVELAEAFRPEVIILDIGLPKLNGYDACRKIRQQPWGKDVLIIAATGWSQANDRRRSEEAGFNCHFAKPVNPDNLERVIARAPPQSHSTANS